MDEEDEYGDFNDEDFMDALSQPSQTLPPLPDSRPTKRRKLSANDRDDEIESPRSRRSRESTGGGNWSGEEVIDMPKKKKYKIHVAEQDVPAARILGATQADAFAAAFPDSSPYRIRGPIYKKPRPEPPKPPTPKVTNSGAQRSAPVADTFFQRRILNPSPANHIHEELVDLPSDAFSDDEPILIGSSPPRQTQENSRPRKQLVAPQQGLRQTTLFGGRAAEPTPSQAKKVHNFIVDKPPEIPTHHVLNQDTLSTWVYPTNLGAIRNYQYSIVKHGLFNNLLVALPTGLGKTFIAATIMFNFFRWTKDAKIVFVAPTKPLVAQQVDACFNIVGIPRSQTTMLTGEQQPALRAEEWESKRVFFMTPQTLDNDLRTGIADPKKIVLLVVDEAHRATGNYAYVKVVEMLRRFNKSFRVIALTATPGASVEAIQEVIDGLEISKVEIRTEESIDIQQYTHRTDVDQIVLDPNDEIIKIKDLLKNALQPLVNILNSQNAYWSKDPLALTPFGLIDAKKKWFSSEAGRKANPGLKGMVLNLFVVLASIAHGIKLLNFHGIGPFYSYVKDFRQEALDKTKPAKYPSQIIQHADFVKMMDTIALWISKDDFIGHPKLTYLCDTVLNHFMDAGEGRLGDDAPPSSTRVIVFSEFRDSAEEIARVLNRHGPMLRASVFVGQQDSKRSEGMNQSKQQETIQQFKKGIFNVIVATSIGEEGLDIGQVDLIVCYDASSSPIRMLQRMGRTGRKRAGRIVLLLMKGKEEDSYTKAKDNYSSIQKMISDGSRFNFRHDLSVRILPRDIVPVVEKRIIEIPIENTQTNALPEPKRRVAKNKKRPPKKFHMPDGVQTGFQKASRLGEDGTRLEDVGFFKAKKAAKFELAPIVPAESVFLSPAEEKELERRYQNVSGNDMQEVTMPDMTAQTATQRFLGPTVKVGHGQYTKRCVGLFSTLSDTQGNNHGRFSERYGDEEPAQDWDDLQYPSDEDMTDVVKPTQKTKPKEPRKSKSPKQKKKQAMKQSAVLSDIESGDEPPARKGRKKKAKHPMNLSDMEDEGPGDYVGMPRGGYSQGRALAAAMSDDVTEGEGDDLLRSEPISHDAASDDWGSLEDFVVDEEESSSRPNDRSFARSSTTPIPDEETPMAEKDKSQFVATQDTLNEDDDLVDLSQLAGKSTKSKSRSKAVTDLEEEESEDEDVRPVSRGQGNRKRKPVVEDDSDE